MAESLTQLRARLREDKAREQSALDEQRQRLVGLLAKRAQDLSVDAASNILILPPGATVQWMPPAGGKWSHGVVVDHGRPGGDKSAAIKCKIADELKGKGSHVLIVDELVGYDDLHSKMIDDLSRQIANEIDLANRAGIVSNISIDSWPGSVPPSAANLVKKRQAIIDLANKAAALAAPAFKVSVLGTFPDREEHAEQICGRCDGGVEWMACTCPPKQNV